YLSEDIHVKTAADAKAILKVLREWANPKNVLHPQQDDLYSLIGLFKNAEGKGDSVLGTDGVPLLVELFTVLHGDTLDDNPYEDNLFHILYTCALYDNPVGLDKIVELAQRGFAAEHYRWSSIFDRFVAERPNSLAMMELLAEPLPGGFIRVTYLDMVNRLAFGGKLTQHPFDTDEGRTYLREYLQGDVTSFAISTTAALPFLKNSEDLLVLAENHSDRWVRLESAWARAKLGQKIGIAALEKAAMDVHSSTRAIQYLQELKRDSHIPEDAVTPQFRALAMMSDWLQHPNEFGRPAHELDIFDTRELFWPPINERTQIWLVKYAYTDEDPVNVGVGMVGATTFALFGENSPELSPEELYGAYCAWELEARGDERAPQEQTVKAGMKILQEYNVSFGSEN
ncbi:MAG: hypothetical protein ACRCYY_02705, partial [Trueperaceae bacterium]